MTLTRSALGLIAAALVSLAACWWLGVYVTAHGEPPALMHAAKAIRGHAIRIAWAFTNAGWPQVLGPLFAACLAVAVFVRSWRLRALYLVVMGVLGWRAADALQRFFARPRRSDWLLRHEHAFSYPSSHASISTAFYFAAAILLLRSELPAWVRYAAFAVLTVIWLGILWSRLALGAHYPTDVLGGVCLGGGLALAGAAVVRLTGRRLAV